VYSADSDLRTHMLVLGTTGSGKPQPVHALVLTPTGWRTMGSLRVGDIVCTPDGGSAAVLDVFEQGEREVWTVRTRDGRKAEATGDHLWRVLVRRPDQTEEAVTITTDAVRELVESGSRVLLPVVRRKQKGARLHGWTPISAVEPGGLHQCRCIEVDHPHHLYVTNDNIVTHNTEFLLGLVFNALVQNTGFIYVDGKGDPKLQKEIFRLCRLLGREHDQLIINFITSGRDFVEKQIDKVTNNLNLMQNTSSGMLIELLVSMMDDSGGGGDMWKGRAISFVAALTRPLTYLRDKGFLNLSPEKYLEFFEINVIEELVWEHNGKYGDMFDVIVAPLRSYLTTLPGYQKSKIKKQEQKTLEQHGFIVMQLTRIFNDLNFNYGHIFKSKVGDVDFFDVVVNRRCLVVLLPALERAPDSLKMLGKLIVGSIKQMMAGCLGNRVEGVVREIIDSRPTNADVPFYTILDEYGYYAVIGFAVAPAQARSLGFAVIFAAQDFSSLKKSSAEEADATWENTNVRAVGRLTSGEESETWRRVKGAASTSAQAMTGGFDRSMGTMNEQFKQQDNVAIQEGSRVDYNDFAMQQDGEFTLLIGKKEEGGKTGGVRVIRGMGFYTASKAPKMMRINDLIPVEQPEPSDLPQNKKAAELLMKSLVDGSFADAVKRCIKPDHTLVSLHQMYDKNYAVKDRPRLGRADVTQGVLGWFLGKQFNTGSPPATTSGGASGTASPVVASPVSVGGQEAPATAPASAIQGQGSGEGTNGQSKAAPTPFVAASPLGAEDARTQQAIAERTLLAISAAVQAAPAGALTGSAYTTAVPVEIDDGDDIRIDAGDVTSLLQVSNDDAEAFRERALPILRSCLLQLDDVDDGATEDDIYDDMGVANTDRMLDVEMAARQRPYTSLEQKWAAEDRIAAVQQDVEDATAYPSPPTPEPRSVEEIRLTIAQIAALCQQQVKSALKE
jgi:intracellular multiplication protein IcmO